MNRLFIFTALFLSAISRVDAQDLAHKIPHDAFAVVNIQTGQFFKLMTVKDFDHSTIGKALLEMAQKVGASDINSVADYGFDLHSTSYFYTSQTDSLTHYIVLIPLSNLQAFERIFAVDEQIEQLGTAKMFAKSMGSEEMTFAWNERMLCISTGTPVNTFFENDEVANRYGITYYNYNYGYENDYDSYYETDTIVDDTATYWNEVEVAPPLVMADPVIEAEEAEIAADSVISDVYDEEYKDAYNGIDTAAVATDWWSDTTTVSTVEDSTPYEDYYTKNVRIKDSLAGVWAQEYAVHLLANAPDESILTNKSYIRSVKKDALMTGWLSNLETIYGSLLPELFGMRGTGKLFSYYGSVYAGLYADGEGFRLLTEMEVSDDLARTFKRIYRPKLNRKFLKYVNSEEAVGFVSMAMDSKAYLEELPKLMNETYGKMFARYENEISLGAEIVSLLLDEEAIASVAKGDGLFVLNGIAEREVTYTDYEYDEDYNYQEIEKTKMETIPDFLAMFSSDNVSLYNRLVNYFQHKMLLTEDGGIYRVEQSDIPFDLYLYRRDNIVFLGTSKAEMESVRDNRYKGSISKAHRKLLTQNRFAGLMSTQKLSEEIPEEQLRSLDSYIAFHKLFGTLGDFYFRSNAIKGNTVAGEFVAQTPEGYDNAVQYLFALIDYAAQQK